MTAQSIKAPATFTIGAIGAMAVIGLAALSVVLTVVAARDTCSRARVAATPSSGAKRTIPARYLSLYRHAGGVSGVPWPVLAAIGSLETDHGRSRAPGVRSGVNRHGCCAGPMQFNTRDGPPSTWERYGSDANHDGSKDIYDPADVLPSAGHYLSVLSRHANGNLSRAILGYNHSHAYVRTVLARARAYASAGDEQLATTPGEPTNAVGCADSDLTGPAGPANLRDAERVAAPRAYRALPSWALAGPSRAGVIDARLYDDAVWILRRYHLRVSAAREGGHHTHGDGTALDLVPADGNAQAIWDASAGALAHDLGWTPSCARSGTRPACQLAPAIQFIGYDGYPDHGSPRTCTGDCPAHLHLSWASPCYGTSSLSPPCGPEAGFAGGTLLIEENQPTRSPRNPVRLNARRGGWLTRARRAMSCASSAPDADTLPVVADSRERSKDARTGAEASAMSTDMLAVLEAVQRGETAPADALARMGEMPFRDLGFARVDTHRELRQGAPEAILAEGKAPDEVEAIARALLESGAGSVLVTRADAAARDALRRVAPDAEEDARARLAWVARRVPAVRGLVTIVSGGTSDGPVVTEARVRAELLGTRVVVHADAGVAGLHRLAPALADLRRADCVVVVAGQDAALASVVGGLVGAPVIGVPTSTGYGAALSGMTALLSMLVSCAAGLAVVNIDDGFGAGTIAARIARSAGGAE